MIGRMRRSRAWRKFFRNRMALVASGVIGLYALVFAFIVTVQITDWIGLTEVGTRQGVTLRVLPRNWPGFLQSPSLEDRYNAADWHLDRLDRLFSRNLEALEEVQPTLDSVALAERRLADKPLSDLRVEMGELEEAFDELDEAYEIWVEEYDAVVSIPEEIKDALEDGDEELAQELRDELAEYEETEAESRVALEAALDRFDTELEDVLPTPTGWDGFVYGFRVFLGSDVVGRSIACRAFYSIKIAFQVGLVVATLSVLIGTLLGAAAGFYGKWVDGAVMWLVSTLSSIPYLVLLAVLAFMFSGHRLFDNPNEYPELQLVKLYTAMGLTFWVGTARVIRGEVMKIKELEYVQAATAIGFGRFYIVLKHVIPNTFHIMFINFSLLFIGAIKNEVILSFLGLGVSGQPSWGTMISNAKDDLSNYFFWEVGAASFLMFALVLAFNIVSDALQDAFDPKHV